MAAPPYHPNHCFEAHSEEFWHGSLRPGDAATNTGARFMVRRYLEKIPSPVARLRIRFLADAGYFGGSLVATLDQAGCGYIIVASKVKDFLAAAHYAGFQPMHFGWGVQPGTFVSTTDEYPPGCPRMMKLPLASAFHSR